MRCVKRTPADDKPGLGGQAGTEILSKSFLDWNQTTEFVVSSCTQYADSQKNAFWKFLPGPPRTCQTCLKSPQSHPRPTRDRPRSSPDLRFCDTKTGLSSDFATKDPPELRFCHPILRFCHPLLSFVLCCIFCFDSSVLSF